MYLKAPNITHTRYFDITNYLFICFCIYKLQSADNDLEFISKFPVLHPITKMTLGTKINRQTKIQTSHT